MQNSATVSYPLPHAVEVPVVGGYLAPSQGGPRPGTGRATVLLIQGATANQRWWQSLVARIAPDVSWVAVDLGDRGLSTELPGPSGLGRHADDLRAVVDQLDVGLVSVVGHSMGAFVATSFAERHPDSVAGLVLVDGGVPVDGRLAAGTAIHRVRCPIELLRCTSGLQPGSLPLIPAEAAAAAGIANQQLAVTTVPGLDHCTIARSPGGVDVVVCAIERMLRRQ